MSDQQEWQSVLTAIGATDPEFAGAFARFAAADTPSALSPKTRSLILFGLNVSVSHRNAVAARDAARAARAHSATREEMEQVAQLTMLLGIHSVALVAEFMRAKLPSSLADDEARIAKAAAIKATYLASRGFIPPPIEAYLAVDPGFVEAYRQLSAIPFRPGRLGLKDIELVVIALDASVNHLHQAGCQAHIAGALAAGATIAEIGEAIELAASMAGQGTALGYAIAAETFAGSAADEPASGSLP